MAGLAGNVRRYLTALTGRDDVSKLFWREKRPGRPATWFVDANLLRSLGVLEEQLKLKGAEVGT